MSVFKKNLPSPVHVLPFRYFFFSFLTSLKSSAHHAVKFSLINTFSAPTTYKSAFRRFNLAFSVQFALCVLIAKSGDDRSGLVFAFRVHSMHDVYVAGC